MHLHAAVSKDGHKLRTRRHPSRRITRRQVPTCDAPRDEVGIFLGLRLLRAAQQLERLEEAARQRAAVHLALPGDADAEREAAHDDAMMDDVDIIVCFADELTRRKA